VTSVFIVRPFNLKTFTVEEKDGTVRSFTVDFEKVEQDLIQPAIRKVGLEAATTKDIAEAGNIRVDMFQRLIAYDLVIADISIDNANVFYELGIRHGLRPNGTILIRFSTPGKSLAFDLQTDRYMQYDRDDPKSAVDQLAKSIQATIDAMRAAERKPDSPVFLLLPQLAAPDPEKLNVVPRDFQEAVEKAEGDAVRGRTTLALLGEEAKRTAWARGGLRFVAHAQRRIRALESARESWEFIRKDLPDDVEANLQLATLYQRLGELVTSSQACLRVLNNGVAERKDRADARSQLARNEKALWLADFKKGATDGARRQQALSDNRLIQAFDGYMEGFAEDLNDYYSGINAFGLLTAIVRLAENEPATWAGSFETAKEAENKLDDYRQQLDRLRSATRISLASARLRSAKRVGRGGKPDEWLPPSEAQFRLLTAENANFVRNAYQAAKNAGGTGFAVESEARQVAIYCRLGLFVDNCSAALEAIGMTLAELDASDEPAKPQPRKRVIVATGHRADAQGRPTARFPNTPECIARAKAWLREAVEAEKAQAEDLPVAIAGAASGTDLLFHEVCAELGLPTMVVLPIPVEDYRRESVKDGGPEWVERFNRLIARNPPVILRDSADLPGWAKDVPNYGVFQRGNIWMMEDALLRPNTDVTLLALWNGKAGDGPGGTADMVKLANEHGAKTIVADTNKLFGLS
jgi:hypothetical protein